MTQNISEPTTGEYEAINFDGLERRANYRTIAYREDILHILERKDAAAILYQIIYRWETEIKRPLILKEIERRKQSKQSPLTFQEVEDMMWVYMSYNDFVRESGGAVAYNTVIRMLDYMIDTKKVVQQRPNHDPGYPDYEYRINRSVVKELLKALPAEPVFTPKVPKKKEKSTQEGIGSDSSTQEGTPPQSSTQMGTESTQEGIATTQMGTEVYPNGGTSHITTHNYSHNYNTKDESITAPESHTPPESPPDVGDARVSLPSKTEAFIEKLREWRIEDEQPEEDITQAETVKVPVAPKKPAPHDVLAVRLADGTEALAQVERYEGKDAVRVIWLEPQGQYVQAWSDVFGQKHTQFESSLPVSVDQNYTNHGIAAFGEYRILSVDEVAGLSIIPLYRRLDRQSQQNTPTPTPTPAQASPPQSEQAALEQTAQQNHSAVTPCSAVVTPDVPPSGVPPTKGKAKKQAEPKTETPKSPPVEPASDMAWGTRKCLLWFDYWRGGILIGKFKLMQASTCAKGLAEQLSEEQVIETRTMMEADPYYIGKGGCDVCDVANNIHKYLRRRKTGTKPAASTPDAVNSDLPPDYDVADEFNRYWGINEKRIVIETRGVSYAAV